MAIVLKRKKAQELTDEELFESYNFAIRTLEKKKEAKKGNQAENGKMMFIYQAHQAFTIWHKILPDLDDKTIKLLD